MQAIRPVNKSRGLLSSSFFKYLKEVCNSSAYKASGRASRLINGSKQLNS